MATIYYSILEDEKLGEVTVFLGKDLEILGVVHCNDGAWPNEFEPIFAKAGVDVLEIDLTDTQLNEARKYTGVDNDE